MTNQNLSYLIDTPCFFPIDKKQDKTLINQAFLKNKKFFNFIYNFLINFLFLSETYQ